jgi:hypothetical protein
MYTFLILKWFIKNLLKCRNFYFERINYQATLREKNLIEKLIFI